MTATTPPAPPAAAVPSPPPSAFPTPIPPGLSPAQRMYYEQLYLQQQRRQRQQGAPQPHHPQQPQQPARPHHPRGKRPSQPAPQFARPQPAQMPFHPQAHPPPGKSSVRGRGDKSNPPRRKEDSRHSHSQQPQQRRNHSNVNSTPPPPPPPPRDRSRSCSTSPGKHRNQKRPSDSPSSSRSRSNSSPSGSLSSRRRVPSHSDDEDDEDEGTARTASTHRSKDSFRYPPPSAYSVEDPPPSRRREPSKARLWMRRLFFPHSRTGRHPNKTHGHRLPEKGGQNNGPTSALTSMDRFWEYLREEFVIASGRISGRANVWFYLFLSTTTTTLTLSTTQLPITPLRTFLLFLTSLLTLLSFLVAFSFRHKTLRNKLTKRISPCYNARGMVSGRGGIMNHTWEVYVALGMGALWAMVAMTVWSRWEEEEEEEVENEEEEEAAGLDGVVWSPNADGTTNGNTNGSVLTVGNGNLYYSTSASALMIAYLVSDLLTIDDPNGTLPLYYRPRNQIHLSYSLLFFSSIALFAFGTSHMSSDVCSSSNNASFPSCRYAVLTVLLAGWNVAVVGWHLGLVSVERNDPHPMPSPRTRKRRCLVDAWLSLSAFVATTINVGVSTSEVGPGREPGNVFWGCWICFAIATCLVMSHVELFLYPNGRVENDIMEEGLMHHYEVMRRKKDDGDDEDDDDFEKERNGRRRRDGKKKLKKKVGSIGTCTSTSSEEGEDEEENDEANDEEVPLNKPRTNAAQFRYHPSSPGSPGSFYDNSTITSYPDLHRRPGPPPSKPTGTSSGEDDPESKIDNKLDEKIKHDREKLKRMWSLFPDPSADGRKTTTEDPSPPPQPPPSPGDEIHLDRGIHRTPPGVGTRPGRERKSRNKALESPGVESRHDLPKVIRASPGNGGGVRRDASFRRRTFSGPSDPPPTPKRAKSPLVDEDDRGRQSLRPSASFGQPAGADGSVLSRTSARHSVRSATTSRPRGRIIYPPEETTAPDVPRAQKTYHILEMKKQDLLNSRAERKERIAAGTPPPEESPEEKWSSPSAVSLPVTRSSSTLPSPETRAAMSSSSDPSVQTKAATLESSSEEGSHSQPDHLSYDSDVGRYVKQALKVAASADKNATVHDDPTRHHSKPAGWTRSLANDGVPKNLFVNESIFGKHAPGLDRNTRNRQYANDVRENDRGPNRSLSGGNATRPRHQMDSHLPRRDGTPKKEIPHDEMHDAQDGNRPRTLFSASRTFSDVEKSSSGSNERNDTDRERWRKTSTARAESGEVESSPDATENDKSSPESSGHNKSSQEKSSPDTVRAVDSGTLPTVDSTYGSSIQSGVTHPFRRPSQSHASSSGNHTKNDQRMAVDNLVAEALERAKYMKHEYEGRKSLVRGNSNGNLVELQARAEQPSSSLASPDSPTEEVSVYSYFSNSNSQSSKSGSVPIGGVYPC